MKTNIKVSVLALVLMVGRVGFVFSAESKIGATSPKPYVAVADKVEYSPMPMAGVSQYVIFSSSKTGGYAAFTKFAAGTKIALHTHSNNISMVIISGTFLYGDAANEKELGSGIYLFIPSGIKHTSGAKTDCVIFEQSNAKFDVTMIK